MSGFWHPIGPESARTYWLRRVGVIAGLLLVAVVLVTAINAIAAGQRRETTQTPVGAPSTVTAPNNSSSSPTDEAKSPAADDKPSSAQPTGSQAGDPSPKPAAKPGAQTSSSKPASDPTVCGKDLRLTLTGTQTVKVADTVEFTAGAINGASGPCTLNLRSAAYEFRIYSGTDRIWSTNDCKSWLPDGVTTLKPEQSVEWKVKWDVKRSKGCGASGPELRPGTYVANSVLEGAEPVQLVMALR